MKLKLFHLLLISVLLLIGIPTASLAQQSQEVILGGHNHKPPVSTSGSGMVTVQLKGDSLKVYGDFENLTSRYSGAYIMLSLRGQGNNQLYRLDADLNEEQTGGTFKKEENAFELSAAQKQLLQKGNLYINVSTFDNQRGELRGDIAPMGK